jgi:hypothetical protein
LHYASLCCALFAREATTDFTFRATPGEVSGDGTSTGAHPPFGPSMSPREKRVYNVPAIRLPHLVLIADADREQRLDIIIPFAEKKSEGKPLAHARLPSAAS